MIGKMTALLVSCAAAVVAVAPAASASGGPGGGTGGGTGGGQTPSTNCQIRQLSNTPVLFATTTAIDTTDAVAGCAAASWNLTYVNTALGTTDFTAVGTIDATGAAQNSVDAGPLPFNYPYRVTLTLTNAAGTVVASKASTLFTPKPRD